MSTLEDIRQRYEAEFARRKERLDKLESDINKAGKRYGISTGPTTDRATEPENDTDNSFCDSADSSSQRTHQVGAEAVHEGGSRNPNRKFAEERG